MNGLSSFVSKPKTAFIGAVIFSCFWFVIGILNDYLLMPSIEGLGDNEYLPWKLDILGHFLSITTLLASAIFWFYDKQIEALIDFSEKFKKKK